MASRITDRLCAASAELEAAKTALDEVAGVIERAKYLGIEVSPKLEAACRSLADDYAAAKQAFLREQALAFRPALKRPQFASTGDALLALS